jgi:vesicle-fusing ATPase
MGTTSQRSVLKQLDLQAIFNRELAVPNVSSHKELASILREVQAFDSEAGLAQSLNELREITGTDQVGVGIKKVLLGVGEAKQEVWNVEGRFAEVIAQQMAASRD